MISFFRKYAQKKIKRWLAWRVSSCEKVILTRKNTYILPTAQGLIFTCVSIGIFLGGVNYANSLILALIFFMVSLFVVSMLYTYRNLLGLQIEAQSVQGCAVGEYAVFTINLRRMGRRTYEAIDLIWGQAEPQRVDLLREENPVGLLFPVIHRGYYRPGYLKIETRYPVGLFKAWAWVKFDMGCWIYPRPIREEAEFQSAGVDSGHAVNHIAGLDDFAGLRSYVPGDSLKKVDWKAFARTAELHSKIFIQATCEDVWLSWENFNHLNLEQRLSALCYWVLFCSQQQRVFGFKIPGFERAPNLGPAHQQQCLEALARFQSS